jgi:NDP-sugar pyrophosphorylase family protein
MIRRSFRVAMVLAAGRGERMQPLSSVVPKPALALPDGPVIASCMRLAAHAGVDRIVVNTWHLAEKMAEAVAEVALYGIEIALSPETELMGTAGGLALARERGLLGQDGPVLVLNGDSVVSLDLEALVERHLDTEDSVTLALLPHLDPGRWSRVILDADGRVAGIHSPGRPDTLEAPFLYPGVMAVSQAAIESLPTAPGDIPEILWKPARKAHRLGGVVVAGHWREVGTPEDYLAVMKLQLAGTTVVHPTASIDFSTSLVASFVGRDVTIEDAAEVDASILAEGVTVRRGARVEHSVLMGKIEVGPNETVTDEVRAKPLANSS